MVALIAIPEFLLVCDATPAAEQLGTWRFSLETADGSAVLDVAETEPGDLNRLALLSVVRGLEAIEGQAQVTLISTSRYVIRGLRDSLHRWRENGFMWEHFGRMLAVPNTDLWQRIDRALQFHQVNACLVTATRVSGHSEAAPREPARPAERPSGVGTADRLRRWLMAQGGSGGAAPRRRYGPADLAVA